VIRLGEFRLLGGCFLWDVFLKKTEAAEIFKPPVCIIFDKNGLGDFSQTHLVTLVPNMNRSVKSVDLCRYVGRYEG
jgi:hypothetical protein